MANREYAKNKRTNMTQELNIIENERLNNLNNNKINKKKTEIQAMLDRKSKYMSEFNSRINGDLNEQDWVGPEMDVFHQKIAKLKQFYCDNCNELWPTEQDKCSTCHKNNISFSSQNDMNPNFDELPINIKSQFEQLTMVNIPILKIKKGIISNKMYS